MSGPIDQESGGSPPYLAVCAIYRDEAPYLREWIEFHRLVGVERFFLYDNLSIDNHRDVLAPYIADGTVVLHDWPISYAAQRPAYVNCLSRHRDDARWIAFLDLDEFLFSPTGQRVSEVLVDYEEEPAVGVYLAWFGTSGHKRPPEGLVIENYLDRMDPSLPGKAFFRWRLFMKSIVDPRRTASPISACSFNYVEGKAVDENKKPLDRGFSEVHTYARLRINHYYSKSEQEFIERRQGKVRVAEGVSTEFRESTLRWLRRELHQTRDETITTYVPALRRALGLGPSSEVAAAGHPVGSQEPER